MTDFKARLAKVPATLCKTEYTVVLIASLFNNLYWKTGPNAKINEMF
jgi:hypothetical protein